jgi:PBP1b-binding outer membrane lipoprotein LpoB
VTKKICLLTILSLAAFGVGCSTANEAANVNTAQAPTQTTSPAPDNSEITTSVSADGTRTETRTFKSNRRISKVVVTTRNSTRTVRATSPSGEEREVKTDENVLEATGDKVADAAGFVADKTEDVAGEAKDKTEGAVDKTVDTSKKVGEKVVDTSKDVGEKTVDTSKAVGEKAADTSKNIGEKTVEGAKKVGSKTASGAKKVGSAVKKVIP